MAAAWTLRMADVADAAQIARLSAQLGYPAPVEDYARRLALILASARHALWVAGAADGRLLGMVGVEQRLMIESGEPAEIVAMVVDRDARRLGIGRALIAAARDWARQRGCRRIFLRSNVLRDHAHAFYPALGFERSKTQHVYEQAL
jgi:GNAT superfamily N-acetyltransferase